MRLAAEALPLDFVQQDLVQVTLARRALRVRQAHTRLRLATRRARSSVMLMLLAAVEHLQACALLDTAPLTVVQHALNAILDIIKHISVIQSARCANPTLLVVVVLRQALAKQVTAQILLLLDA